MITDETLKLDSIFKGMKVTEDSDFGFIPNTLYFAMKEEGDFNLWLTGNTGDGTFYPANIAIPEGMTLEEAQVGTGTEGKLASKEVLDAFFGDEGGVMVGNEQTETYLLEASDLGKSIDTTADVELPAGVFPSGAVVMVTNVSDTAIHIHPMGNVTLNLNGLDYAGSCSVPPYSMATLYQQYTNNWIVTGVDNL